MDGFVKVAKISEIPDGEIRGRKVGDVAVALINLGGEIFATSDICSHEHCELSGGFLENKNIVCPCHGSQFDTKTGEVKSLPATEPIKIFEVQIKDGAVFVKI